MVGLYLSKIKCLRGTGNALTPDMDYVKACKLGNYNAFDLSRFNFT